MKEEMYASALWPILVSIRDFQLIGYKTEFFIAARRVDFDAIAQEGLLYHSREEQCIQIPMQNKKMELMAGPI